MSTSEWGVSENNRKAKYYSLTRAGHKQLNEEMERQGRMSAVINRVRRTSQPCASFSTRSFAGWSHRPAEPLEGDLEQELHSRLDMAVEANLSKGTNTEVAQSEAVLGFGGVEKTKELYRDQRGLS